MSDIQPVLADAYRNFDDANRVPYGAIPIGDGEQVVADDRRSVESFMPGSERSKSFRD